MNDDKRVFANSIHGWRWDLDVFFLGTSKIKKSRLSQVQCISAECLCF
jgi:hypothetical protein